MDTNASTPLKGKKPKKNVKKRHWAAVVYPESLPPDWRDIIAQTGIKAAISPLHDQDISADGTPKKPHHHVIMSYDGPTTYNVVLGLVNGRLGQPAPQPLESVKGYYRYLTHMDDPDKAQYDPAGITTLNGFAVSDYVTLSSGDVLRLKRELIGYIRDHQLTEYADLLDMLMVASDSDEHSGELLMIAMSHTIMCKAYLTSNWRRQHLAQQL